MKTARLLKVLVQPVMVVDDGENLTEVVVNPVPIGAAQWDEFAAHGFHDAVARLKAEMEASDG